jgi:hypothetical protein
MTWYQKLPLDENKRCFHIVQASSWEQGVPSNQPHVTKLANPVVITQKFTSFYLNYSLTSNKAPKGIS